MTSKEALKDLGGLQMYYEDGDYQCQLEEHPDFKQDIEIIKKDLEVLEILKPFLKKVLEINEDGTEVFFKAVRYFNGYVVDINGSWNETEQIKKNKKVKEWLENDR